MDDVSEIPMYGGALAAQVVIKLQDTEPDQLVPDVIKSTADALRSSG
jgi:hypothetical protein